MELSNEEVDLINELVEPFIKAQHADNRPCASGIIDRGVILTMLDANKSLRRIRVEVISEEEDDVSFLSKEKNDASA